jgi:hypothetical protein
MLQSHNRVTVDVDGTNLRASCRAREGGAVGSDTVKIRPGGMAPSLAFPGPREVDTVTVRLLYRHGEQPGLYDWLRARVGRRMVVKQQPLDPAGSPGFETPYTWQGILSNVGGLEYDADSNDPAEVELSMEPDDTFMPA